MLLLAWLLCACANSASHEVVTTSKSSDIDMTCREIEIEKARMHYIIDEVHKDKKDMTGADVVDGLLWFPFNVMVKQGNYSNAIKAAEGRLERLAVLSRENGCKKK